MYKMTFGFFVGKPGEQSHVSYQYKYHASIQNLADSYHVGLIQAGRNRNLLNYYRN
jgi:hypothetical protein